MPSCYQCVNPVLIAHHNATHVGRTGISLITGPSVDVIKV